MCNNDESVEQHLETFRTTLKGDKKRILFQYRMAKLEIKESKRKIEALEILCAENNLPMPFNEDKDYSYEYDDLIT